MTKDISHLMQLYDDSTTDGYIPITRGDKPSLQAIFKRAGWLKESGEIDYKSAYPYIIKNDEYGDAFNVAAYILNHIIPSDWEYMPQLDWAFRLPYTRLPDRVISWRKLVNFTIVCRHLAEITKEDHIKKANVTLETMNMFEEYNKEISIKDFSAIMRAIGIVINP